MSNNAAVTADGGEIGRAQALQARAARVAPSVHMNPVLLKPQSEIGAQIVVQGRVYGSAKAAAYQQMKRELMPFVLESFARLRGEADLVLVEGAGSAAEVNLRANDIANMGFARAADVPVVLIGDIDRGGVIASLVGTKAVLGPRTRRWSAASSSTSFAAMRRCSPPAWSAIAQATGWEALGLVPLFRGRAACCRPRMRSRSSSPRRRHVRRQARVQESRCRSCRTSPTSTISIRSRPSPRSIWMRVRPGAALPGDADLVILPGSKATIADLAALRAAGFDIDIAAHRRRGGMVLGLCGGYQMLGPHDRRSRRHRRAAGNGRRARPARCRDHAVGRRSASNRCAASTSDGAPFAGYEMHMGVTAGPDCARPFARLADGSADGAISPDGRVIGHLRARAVRRRPAARGVACAFRRPARRRSPTTI